MMKGKKKEMSEITNWKLQYRDNPPLAAQTPCSLYSVLLEYKLIPHPYQDRNEAKIRDLCKDDCEFTASFTLEETKDMVIVFQFAVLIKIHKNCL